MTPTDNAREVGEQMYKWAIDLFPINRSLTGSGVRQTLTYLSNLLPGLTIHEVPSGTVAFDWTVPDEWTIRDAYIENETGERVVDFHKHNLHILGYSEPVDVWLGLDELNQYLYSLPDQPDAIPYVTSYYARRWGFCMTHNQRLALPTGRYHAVVDSTLKPGVLNYAELILQGEKDEEIFLSTYICHPSMANNELSGPVVTTALVKWLQNLEKRRYTYRIVFIPETIGSIVYLSRNIEKLKRKVVAGFNITCIGDERCYSYLPSRAGDTLADHIAQHVLHHTDSHFKRYSWLDRGSDERQYCAPGIDLPIATIMRSKYGEYPEYHTSLDNFEVVTPQGLEGGFIALRRCLEILEKNVYLNSTTLCEPQLGKRGLYPLITSKASYDRVRAMNDLISYCDGTKTLLQISGLIKQPFWSLLPIAEELIVHGVLVQDFRLKSSSAS
jgi:aminopeptidase-like protein